MGFDHRPFLDENLLQQLINSIKRNDKVKHYTSQAYHNRFNSKLCRIYVDKSVRFIDIYIITRRYDSY
jgi:hypothetical protein